MILTTGFGAMRKEESIVKMDLLAYSPTGLKNGSFAGSGIELMVRRVSGLMAASHGGTMGDDIEKMVQQYLIYMETCGGTSTENRTKHWNGCSKFMRSEY